MYNLISVALCPRPWDNLCSGVVKTLVIPAVSLLLRLLLSLPLSLQSPTDIFWDQRLICISGVVCISGIIYSLWWGVLLSYSLWLSWDSSMCFHVSIVHPFAEQYSTVWMYHALFIHLPVDGHLGFFQFFTISSAAAIVFIWQYKGTSLWMSMAFFSLW